jgi:hypothetical protein
LGNDFLSNDERSAEFLRILVGVPIEFIKPFWEPSSEQLIGGKADTSNFFLLSESCLGV